MDSLQRNCDKMVFKFCLCSHSQQKKRKGKAGLCNSVQSCNFSVIFKPLFATLQTKIILKRSFTFRGILDTCKTGQSILNVTSVDHGTECTRIYYLRTRATCRVWTRAGNEPSEQSRPLLCLSPDSKNLIALSHLRHYAKQELTHSKQIWN